MESWTYLTTVGQWLVCLLTLKKSGEVLGHHFFTPKPGRGRDRCGPPTALIEPWISCPEPHSVMSIKSHGRIGGLPTLCTILSKSVEAYSANLSWRITKSNWFKISMIDRRHCILQIT